MKIAGILARKGTSVVTAPPSTSVAQFIQLLAEHRIGAVLVVSDGRTVGIVSERDVVRRLAEVGAGALDQPISELMSTELVTCTPEDSLDDIAVLMTERRIRHLPVLADGELTGIVTIGDVVAARLRELEQTRAQLESYITQG
ncbi:MAG: CBS domain-containing protein [Jatrophihabitantaceae bacterium]